MFVKLVVLACSVAATLAAWNGPLAGGVPADRYPAGINPQACPNFPNCENPAVALTASAPGAPAPQYAGAQSYGQWNNAPANNWNNAGANNWNSAGQWNGAQNNAQWNSAQDNGQWNGNQGYSGDQNALNVGGYTGDGDYRGEGLAESGAFGDNSGYNTQAAPASYNSGYAGHAQPAQVPAGVDPSSCPNYPYCQ